MSNEQVKQLLDMVFTIPKSSHYYVKFEYDNEDDHVSLFISGKKRCECCGQLEDTSTLKISDDYDEMKAFIEKWREIIEKENENDRGNN